ncbi:MAG: DUF6427 family protein [Bacteroidota bacterium]|nr:DUF6427 family protein [Bacteroidota bacterium]
MGINKLLSSYRKDTAFSQSFDAGFLFSIASLFYFPYFVFFPLLGVALIILRPFNWREWLISFIGVLVPYIFVGTVYFLTDKLDYLLHDKMLFDFIKVRPVSEIPDSFYFMICIGWLIVLLSFLSLFKGLNSGPQKAKKGIILLIWFFLFSALSVLLAPQISTVYFSAMAIPASVFCANYFLNLKRVILGELLFILLLISIFLNLILHFF